MVKLSVYLFLATVLLIAHANARNIPTVQTKTSDDHAENPSSTAKAALVPIPNKETLAAAAGAGAPSGTVDDQKNFITYGGVGGWGGIGGWGLVPLFGGIGGVGKAGGIGIGGVAGLGKAGGVGVGSVGGAGGIIP